MALFNNNYQSLRLAIIKIEYISISIITDKQAIYREREREMRLIIILLYIIYINTFLHCEKSPYNYTTVFCIVALVSY